MIEKILKHCGLWDRPTSRAPPRQPAPQQLDLEGAERVPERPCHGKDCRVPQGRLYVDIDALLMAL